MSDSEDDSENFNLSQSPSLSTLECLPGLFKSVEDEGYPHEYYFSEISHALSLLKGLDQQRQERTLCDVIICVEDQEFYCHRNVLAACSPYFRAMFSGEMRESMEQKVCISGIDPEIMKQLIDYAYTSDITINQENAQHLLSAANMVQINSIRDACCNFLKKEMDPSNCLGIHCFAEAHVCESLADMSKSFALQHFAEVAQHEEVLLLSRSKLIEVIQSDGLRVSSEDVVFQAVIDWFKHDLEARSAHLADVMKHVRLSLVDPYFLFDKVDSEPFLSEDPVCRKLVQEATRFMILKDRQVELSNRRTHFRGSQVEHKWLITIGGEIYNKNYLNSVDCYSFEEGKWLRLKELPFPRCHHGTCVSQGKYIYVAGGFSKDKQVLNNVMRYEPMLDKWMRVANMNGPRARHGMATLDGYIYVLGGYDGQGRMASIERYNPRTNKWTLCSKMDMAISRCAAVGHKGFLYVAGGTIEPSNQCVDTFLRYDPRNDTWQTLLSLPTPHCLCGLLSIGDHVYAVGGTEEMLHASRRLMKYDTTIDKWSALPEMIESRFDAGATVNGNKIYVLSGHDGENSFYHNIEEYDLDTQTWSVMTSTNLPYGRCRFGCVVISMPTVR